MTALTEAQIAAIERSHRIQRKFASSDAPDPKARVFNLRAVAPIKKLVRLTLPGELISVSSAETSNQG